jgi:hypothetical protein
MKLATKKVSKQAALALVPSILLIITSCSSSSNPTHTGLVTSGAAYETRAELGGAVVVDSITTTDTVVAIDAATRKIELKHPDGRITAYKAGPNVVNFDQIKVGDEVKANAPGESAIFLVRNGPLPAAGAGVIVTGAAKGDVPAGMLLATRDFSARVIAADRSYRMLTLEYLDGKTKTFKVPLPFTLENAQKGDDAVVRTTETVAVRMDKH